jgi:hypothetical protein
MVCKVWETKDVEWTTLEGVLELGGNITTTTAQSKGRDLQIPSEY